MIFKTDTPCKPSHKTHWIHTSSNLHSMPAEFPFYRRRNWGQQALLNSHPARKEQGQDLKAGPPDGRAPVLHTCMRALTNQHKIFFFFLKSSSFLKKAWAVRQTFHSPWSLFSSHFPDSHVILILHRLALLSDIFRMWIMNGWFWFCCLLLNHLFSSSGTTIAWGVTTWFYVMLGIFPRVSTWFLIPPATWVSMSIYRPGSQNPGFPRVWVPGSRSRAPHHRSGTCLLNTWHTCQHSCPRPCAWERGWGTSFWLKQ